MAKKEKGFNLKLYAILAFVVVAVVLTLIVTFTFKSNYTAYHPDEVARNYADTIVQTGDGYNAYKNALVSKSEKYGNYIRKYFIYPIIFSEAGYKPGDSTKGLTGLNDKSNMGEKTENDDGTLQGQVINTMYDYYAELIQNGWDNYDEIFTAYFTKLCEVRAEIFGDKYMTDEIMFTALESNVKTFGQSLTGTEDEFDENTGNQTSVKTIGSYQTAFGEDYKFTCVVKNENDIDLSAYKAVLNTDTLATYGVHADDITDVKCYTVDVKADDGTVVTSADITVAKIGNSWYVDSAATDTSSLYGFYLTK